jgi:hypothetical protein
MVSKIDPPWMTTWATGTPTTEYPPPPSPPEFSESRLADGGWWAGVPRPPKTTSGIHFFQDLHKNKQEIFLFLCLEILIELYIE